MFASNQSNAQKPRHRPVVLIIIDGWGISFEERGNAILAARTPNMDRYLREYPCGALQASGIEVGLPWGEIGNSETGHKNIGAGQVMYQSLPQITLSIKDGSFFQNPAFLEAAEHVKKNESSLHFMGLVSNGGVHSHIDHLLALIDFARQQKLRKQVFVHAFTDGRDVPPQSAKEFIEQLSKHMRRRRTGAIATVAGRYWALDRNKNWDRTRRTYDAMVYGKGPTARSAMEVIEKAYAQNQWDEKIEPHVIVNRRGEPIGTIKDGDAVIFFDFRPDRARQLTYAFVQKDFSVFPVKQFNDLDFVTMTEYDAALSVTIAFKEQLAPAPMAAVISKAGLRQLHIAETEKYAHVTYFLNNGREKPYPGEDQVLIPSPDVKDYAETPAMSAAKIAARVVREIKKDKYDFIVVNFANPDMIGHTGKFKAAVKACGVVDECVGKIVAAALAKGGAVLITADHGNAEEMINPQTGEVETDHTTNLVPLIYITPDNHLPTPKSDETLMQILLAPLGVLSDVGPSTLAALGLKAPPTMTAQNLLPSLT
jgi:2,3-bisphosphoglycerate-independent phosphoglycerate mutase